MEDNMTKMRKLLQTLNQLPEDFPKINDSQAKNGNFPNNEKTFGKLETIRLLFPIMKGKNEIGGPYQKQFELCPCYLLDLKIIMIRDLSKNRPSQPN